MQPLQMQLHYKKKIAIISEYRYITSVLQPRSSFSWPVFSNHVTTQLKSRVLYMALSGDSGCEIVFEYSA